MCPMVFIIVRRNRADLRDHLAGDGLGEFVQLALDAVTFFVEAAGDCDNGLLDAALHGHRVRAGCNGLDAFAVDCLRENGSGGGAIAGYVRGLRSNFADHLGAHVLEAVLEFDFFGYGDAVFGDGRRTEFLFDNNVAALRAESDFHSISQKVDAAENGLAGLFSVNNLFCHCVCSYVAGWACGSLRTRSQVLGVRSQET